MRRQGTKMDEEETRRMDVEKLTGQEYGSNN